MKMWRTFTVSYRFFRLNSCRLFWLSPADQLEQNKAYVTDINMFTRECDSSMAPICKDIYPATTAFLPSNFTFPPPAELPGVLAGSIEKNAPFPPFLPDLAKVEWSVHTVGRSSVNFTEITSKKVINPTLELLPVSWSGLPGLLQGKDNEPIRHQEYLAVYQRPEHQVPQIVAVSGHDLLAMKIVAEELDKREVAKTASTSVATINAILYQAQEKGLILSAGSKIRRSMDCGTNQSVPEVDDCAEVFTLQWHVTQKCDLHCRHCYDRSNRKEMSWQQAVRVLDCMYDFCESYNVQGQVSFSGGNPLLYPHFTKVYQEAADRGFLTAILGNPTSREILQKLIDIQPPEFYQVSLEGLRAHNDIIRGFGHFDRVMTFLELLGDLGVYSMVMLTLTQDNMEDVFALAELLRDKVDLFTFNRLASVGEGAQLAPVPPEDYVTFLERYEKAAAQNPILSFKDNLFNILQDKNNLPLRGGCTGFGCGAAFNFLSVLPDGEIHACRKFPSYIGNINERSLIQAYQSERARGYRRGSAGCATCAIRRLCRGCAAVVYGSGEDIFTAVDPYCFRQRISPQAPRKDYCIYQP